MGILDSVSGFLKREGGNILESAGKGKSIREGLNNAWSSALPAAANHMRRTIRNNPQAHQIMSKYGRPIRNVLQQGKIFMADANQPGGSYKQAMLNQADKALGFVRDKTGNLLTEKEASNMGYSVDPSRYGGNIAQGGTYDDTGAGGGGDDDVQMNDQMDQQYAQDGGEFQPNYGGMRAGRARRMQRRANGGGFMNAMKKVGGLVQKAGPMLAAL